MKLLDVNIWLALSLPTHDHYEAARAWLNSQGAAVSVYFCRPTQQGLLRLLTTEAVMKGYGKTVMTNSDAWQAYDRMIADRRAFFVHEPPGLDETWKSLALRKTPSPKLWMDAYLAAFAIRSGFQLVSADKAFSQFKDLDFHLIGED